MRYVTIALAAAVFAFSLPACLPVLRRSSPGDACCPGGVCPLPPAARPATAQPVVVDLEKREVRLSAVVQKTDAPRMNDFGSHFSALLGCKGGKVDENFVFLVDAWTPEVYAGLLKLGARPRATFGSGGAVDHAGAKLALIDKGYMEGDALLIWIEWQTPQGTQRRAYQDFFIEKAIVDGKEVIKPWTPHFVLHGSGVLNDTRTGCIACTHDCPGGIIANNQFPLKQPIPTLKANWDLLPPPGTRVTVILRPVPSAPPNTQGALPEASPPPKAEGAK